MDFRVEDWVVSVCFAGAISGFGFANKGGASTADAAANVGVQKELGGFCSES